MSWLDEGFLLRARKTNSTDFWKNFSFQRNLGFDLGAVEEKKGSVHMAKYLLEFTGKTCNESLDFLGKKGAKNMALPEAFHFSFHFVGLQIHGWVSVE